MLLYMDDGHHGGKESLLNCKYGGWRRGGGKTKSKEKSKSSHFIFSHICFLPPPFHIMLSRVRKRYYANRQRSGRWWTVSTGRNVRKIQTASFACLTWCVGVDIKIYMVWIGYWEYFGAALKGVEGNRLRKYFCVCAGKFFIQILWVYIFFTWKNLSSWIQCT